MGFQCREKDLGYSKGTTDGPDQQVGRKPVSHFKNAYACCSSGPPISSLKSSKKEEENSVFYLVSPWVTSHYACTTHPLTLQSHTLTLSLSPVTLRARREATLQYVIATEYSPSGPSGLGRKRDE